MTKNIFLLVIIFFVLSSCQNAENEKLNKEKSISIVQNYSSSETPIKLINALRTTSDVMRASGRIFEIQGWLSEKISNNLYKVTLELRDGYEDKRIQWAVDIETATINPLDNDASLLLGLTNNIVGNTSVEDWLIGTWSTSKNSEVEFRLTINPSNSCRFYMLNNWYEGSYQVYDNTLVMTRNNVDVQFRLDKKKNKIFMSSGEELLKW